MKMRSNRFQQRSDAIGQKGLSLIELLVALLLSAMLAVMAWRGLDHVARSSQQVIASTEQSQGLNQVMSQLETDLMEAAQLRQSGQFAVQMMNFPVAQGAESSWLLMQRVMSEASTARNLRWVRWDVRNGVLTRSLAETGQSQALLRDLRGMELRPIGPALSPETMNQPERWSGLEVLLVMQNGQRLRRVLSMRD
ncbi:MAG: prepilin-type N-terminal cleavage/methylation domain-containing protein [Betaproteobacteria bacterium]|nr:prepilin-type N-terminal cleavage/methylation domain-containing protein [Betaproteobacteria bacterium]NDA32226.1 prepilin-type N-terminal cleavage/methylation domain-containing protein [Betaproteobacteria bacterium]NDA55576.1 prepilin-type N-terminal cleavage/methylation domain-containing protein [Betaproteobacteria bacterium]